jgi:transposase InsO family protein
MHDPALVALFMSLLGALRSAFRTRAELAIENLALRQQLANLRHTSGRPRIRMADRAFWLVLSRLWSRWADVLVIVKPDTVVRWHRAGFRIFWRWKSRSRRSAAASEVSAEVKALILEMSEANVGWGAPRIHGELLKLGIDIGERSVFLVLSHDRRRVVHWNVTSHPGAQWTAQQIVEAFPEDTAPKYMVRDRDGIYGEKFQSRVEGMGIQQVLTAPRSPWQNPYAERIVGSVRRECLDHVIVLGEQHLYQILKSYFDYYHRSRTHLSLGKDPPEPRSVRPPTMGKVVALPEVGGLHHRYERLAA